MKQTIIRIGLSIATLFLLQLSVFAQKKDLLFSFCNFEMNDELIQRSTNFTESFHFVVNPEGKAANIKRALGKYVDPKLVEECTGVWRFTGFEQGSRGTIVFTWEHGFGWTSMQVKSEGLFRFVTNRSTSAMAGR